RRARQGEDGDDQGERLEVREVSGEDRGEAEGAEGRRVGLDGPRKGPGRRQVRRQQVEDRGSGEGHRRLRLLRLEERPSPGCPGCGETATSSCCSPRRSSR